MENQVYFGNLFPQVKSMLYTDIHPDESHGRVHEKLSYAYRVFVVTFGNLTLLMDGEEKVCHPGDTVFLCPRQKYVTIFDDPVCTTINLVFEFSDRLSEKKIPRQAPGFLMCFNGETENPDFYYDRLNFVDLPAFNSSFMISGVPDAAGRMTEMHRLYMADDLFSHLKLNAAALSFISDVAEYATGINSREKSGLTRRILDYIDEHISERLTCEGIAEKFSYHPSYINRLVRSYTGYTLRDYITRRKIREATRLLTGTDLSMTEIAYRLAFYDSSHFSKVYQTQMKMTPTEVRKAWRRK